MAAPALLYAGRRRGRRAYQRRELGCPAQEPGGEERVQRRGQHGWRECPQRNPRRQPGRRRMNHMEDEQGQYPPEQGEQKAYPSAQIEGQVGVIPKGYPKDLFIKQPGHILHCRAHQGGGGEEKGQAVLDQRRQEENGQCPQAVHRADGEHQPALPVPFDSTHQADIGHLHQKAEKTVNQKVPKPHHKTAPLRPFFIA